MAVITVNNPLVSTYGLFGQYIVAFEQKGAQRAEYGKFLIDNFSKDLTL